MEASKAMVSSPSGWFWPAASPPHVARSRKNEAKTTPAFAIMDSSRAHRNRGRETLYGRGSRDVKSERNVWGGSRRPGGSPRAHDHAGLGRRRTCARAGRGHAGTPRRLAPWHRAHDPRGPHPPPAGAPRRGLSAARARFQPERATPAAAHSVQRALGEHLAAPVLSLLARLGTRHALRRAARLDQLDCSRSLRHPLGDPVGPLRAAPRLSDFLQRQHPRYGWTDPCPRSHGAARAGRCAGRLRGRSRDRRPAVHGGAEPACRARAPVQHRLVPDSRRREPGQPSGGRAPDGLRPAPRARAGERRRLAGGSLLRPARHAVLGASDLPDRRAMAADRHQAVVAKPRQPRDDQHAGVDYLLTIVFIGGAFPNKSLTDPIYSLFSMEVVKDRERGTTNGIMHAFSEFPMGVGAWIAGPFMASGNWTMPYCLAGAVYTLAFLTFYAYFSRVESARALAAESAA